MRYKKKPFTDTGGELFLKITDREKEHNEELLRERKERQKKYMTRGRNRRTASYLQRSDGILVWDGLQVLIQVIDQGRASGDVQLRDDVIWDIVQIFH